MSEQQHDRVYRNIRLVDGTGDVARQADVAVLGDRISAIGAPDSLTSENVVDGAGQVLTPGFIDIHSHADFPFIIDGRAHSAVTQGVTTVVPGNCGFGVAPFQTGGGLVQSDMSPGVSAELLEGLGDVTQFPAYLDAMRDRGVGVNVLPLAAHGLLRASVAGFELRELSRAEIRDMTAMVSEAMEAGAAGLSSGLEYAPGIASTTAELAAIAVPVGAAGGFYATHCRNRTERMIEAAEEAIYIAESSGARLEMSHFVRRPTHSDRSLQQRAMELIRAADARGVPSRYDVFPFEYGPTPITMFVPQTFRNEAGSNFGAMLGDATFVRRIIEDLDPRFVDMLEQGIATDMYVSGDGQDGRYVGLTVGQVAEKMGLPVAHAAIQMLVEAGPSYGAVMVNERWADWEDIQTALSDPNWLLMGDGSMANLDGPLANQGLALADWGWATVTLGRFVRELGVLTLEDAVRRMTSGPATQIGLSTRGEVREGFAADLVLFDPDTVGSDVRPDNLPVVSTGIVEVLVNGVPVVEGGRPTNRTPGRVGMHDVNR